MVDTQFYKFFRTGDQMWPNVKILFDQIDPNRVSGAMFSPLLGWSLRDPRNQGIQTFLLIATSIYAHLRFREKDSFTSSAPTILQISEKRTVLLIVNPQFSDSNMEIWKA